MKPRTIGKVHIMSHQWEFPQSNAEQEITVAYEDPAFPDFPLYESYMQCFPNEQLSQLDVAVNAGSTAWEWPEHADLAPHRSAGQEVCLLESIVEGQNVLIEPSSEEQGLKHVVSELGDRVNKLEEGMEHRVNRFEEGMEQRMAKVEQIVENLQIG
jgi:hypothetical protein